MSDFLFTSKQQQKGILTNYLKSIHLQDPPDCFEYHGSWGSLGVLYNHYYGFNPYEDEQYLLAVIGGPILKFSGAPSFSKTMPQNAKTMAVLRKWKKNGGIIWDKDLSGPFAIICIDKREGKTEIVTDMMSFIPVYQAATGNGDKEVVIGTHVDVVAEIHGRNRELDEISLVDFLVNNTVTFPYTLYKDMTQIPPATITLVEKGKINRSQENNYWLPFENNRFSTLREAAYALRMAMQASIQDICENHEDIGVLLSGGEDSRAVLAAIPKEIKKTGYVLVDSHNRESKTAEKIAAIYDADFEIGYRSPTHYLEQLKECSRLIGIQNEFIHMHAYGFHKKFGFSNHDAILGGLLSDAFIKGNQISVQKSRLKGIEILPTKIKGNSLVELKEIRNCVTKKEFTNVHNRSLFYESFVDGVFHRRQKHLEIIKGFRPTTSAEWFNLWPISQDRDICNFVGNRRLFRSFEPFMSLECLKVAASVPQVMKINRRLFQKAMRPFMAASWYVPHSVHGFFPFCSRLQNIPLVRMVKLFRKISSRIKKDFNNNQGPWPNWSSVVKTERMHELIEENKSYYRFISSFFIV